MAHRVTSVQDLHTSAVNLYNESVVGGGEASADSILNNLNLGIENLKANWKGKDAGYRIQEVISVHNAMVSVRNALAELAVESSKVAHMYREIQNSNGAGLDDLSLLSFEAKTFLSEYSDTADTIDINAEVNTGKNYIDNANSSIDTFLSNVRTKYTEIMDNWTEGPGRDTATEAFQTFMNNVGNYKQVLSDASNNITVALQNYTL